MSERTGTTITCDRHSCRDEISRPTAEEAREATTLRELASEVAAFRHEVREAFAPEVAP